MKANLPKLLTLTLALEFILAPIAPAMAEETKKSNVMNTINQGLNIGSGLMQSAGINTMGIGGGNMGVYSNDLQMLEQQKIPTTDPEVFNSAMLKSKIPGLAQYLATHPANLDCAVLKPLNVVEPDICDPSGGGIPQDPRVAQMYLQQANQFKTSFKDIKLLYSDSSKEFQGAKACMSSATNVLENFFNDKLSELDKLTNELNRMNAEFIKGSAGEKSEIALATEILDGKDAKLTADTDAVFRDSELKKLKAEFSNPACASIDGFKAENLAATGLRPTQTKLTDDMNLKSPNGLNGASFTSKYGEVVADINKVANNAATYLKTHIGETGMGQNGLSSVLAGIPSQVGSNFGINSLIKSTEYSDLSTAYNNDVLPLNKLQATAQSELSSFKSLDPEVMKSLADPNSTNFDSLLGTMENKVKQECLNRALSSTNSSLDYIKSKSYDPTKSKEANKNSTYIFDTALANILNDPTTSPEEKIARINIAKKDERRVVKQSSWFNVATTDGSTPKTVQKGNISASEFYTEVINNCNAQFKTNKLKSSMTGQSAIDTLKSLRSQYTKMAGVQAEKLKAAITQKLINCQSSDVANSSQPGSCSPARFDTSKSGFCAAAANSCSTNMQACTAQTKQKVETLEKARTLKVQNYNILVKNHVAALKTLYDKTQAMYEAQTKIMQGGFPALGVASFSLPGGIDSDPKTTKLAGFSEHDVFLEDPAAAFASFKNNVTLLKGEVTKYQTALMKGVKDYSNKKVALYSSVSSDAGQMEQNCTAAIGGFNKAMGDKNVADTKLLSEFGEKLPEFCDRFGTAHDRPDVACQGDTAELVKSALLASNKLGSSAAAQAATEFQRVCRSYAGEKSTESATNVWSMCKQIENKADAKGKEACTEYTEIDKLTTTSPNFKEKCAGTKSYSPIAPNTSCEDEDDQNNTSKCKTILGKANCEPVLADLEKKISRAYSFSFANGVTVDGPKLDSSTSSPEFCVAEDSTHYRYNPRVLQQSVVGQQGGAVASGM